MVLEHITTREAVQYVEVTGPNVAATITAHHLLLNRNALFLGGIRPHHYCLPVLKREEPPRGAGGGRHLGQPEVLPRHRQRAACAQRQGAACGCAGIYTAHAAIELYAAAFEEAGALDKLEGFASVFGAQFYGLPLNAEHDHARARGVARPGAPRLRGRGAGAAARRRNRALEARSSASRVRRGAALACAERSLDALNALAEKQGLRTESGRPVRFVAPGEKDAYYEIQVYETGRVETRPDSLHDYFNALAWLAFPLTKARINAMHAAEIPRERGRRGRLRDLLTIFDEGGAIVQCDDAELISLLKGFEWKKLFWENRERVVNAMRVVSSDTRCSKRRSSRGRGSPAKSSSRRATRIRTPRRATGSPRFPRTLRRASCRRCRSSASPGWHAENARAVFYDDTRYFRPLRGSARERRSGSPGREAVPPDGARPQLGDFVDAAERHVDHHQHAPGLDIGLELLSREFGTAAPPCSPSTRRAARRSACR